MSVGEPKALWSLQREHNRLRIALAALLLQTTVLLALTLASSSRLRTPDGFARDAAVRATAASMTNG